jgi:exonuclease SbcD
MSEKRIPCALLINDIHVSKDNIPEFQRNWGEALEICKKQDIPEIIIGGDLLQSRSSYQTLDVLLAVRQAIIKATNDGLELTIAEGNHDLVDQEAILGYCHVFSEYPHVYVVDDYVSIDCSDDVTLYVMSYAPESGSFINRLKDIIDNDLDKNKHNILYIHEGIKGGLAMPSDDELPTKIFKDFDAVLVGHYHNRCKIKGTNIEYVGASRQHNFGEDEEKGYTILYDDGSYEFIKNESNTRYKVIDLALQDVGNHLIEELNDIKSNGKYKVKARINCSATDVQNIDKQKLLEAGAAKVEIVTEKTVAKSIEVHSLDRKFDKTGIKQEYESFCSEKVIDSSMGLQYLDKIH